MIFWMVFTTVPLFSMQTEESPTKNAKINYSSTLTIGSSNYIVEVSNTRLSFIYNSESGIIRGQSQHFYADTHLDIKPILIQMSESTMNSLKFAEDNFENENTHGVVLLHVDTDNRLRAYWLIQGREENRCHWIRHDQGFVYRTISNADNKVKRLQVAPDGTDPNVKIQLLDQEDNVIELVSIHLI